MSPRDQKTLEKIYAFYSLQDELLKADKRSSKVRREMRGKIAALMQLVPQLEQEKAHLHMGGAQPSEIARAVIEHIGIAA